MSNEEEQILNIKVRYDDAINGIVKYKQAIEELQKAERVLQQDYKNGKITQEEYAKTTTAIAEQTKEYKGHIRELSKEIQNNIKTEKENEGSLRQLRAELSNVTKAYDSLSEAERKGAKGQELKKHINEITDKLKGAEAETQRFYRNVGNYEESIKGALGVNTSFAKSIMGMAEGGKGFGGIVEGMMTKVRAFGAALMSMMANPVFLSLAGIAGAGMAFKWFQDYNEGLMKASKLTTYFTGKNGEEMKAYRNEVMAVADALGIDFAETLKTANSLAQAFGISQEEALQKVKDGYLVGGANVENFTQQLKTNAAAFVDLGVDADQYVGIMSQMGKTGLDVTTSMKAIEKGGLALRKMNKGLSDDLKAIGINSDDMVAKISSGQMTTLQAMQEVAKKLEEKGATAQQTAQVMSDLFGRGAQALGSQFIHVLEGIGKGVSDIKSKSSEVVKLKDENIKVQAQLNNTISSMFDMTGGGYEKMKAQITLITSKALLAMAQAVLMVVNYFIDLYNESTLVSGLVEVLTAQFKGMWNAVKLVFNLIVDSAKGAGRSLKGIAEILEGIITFSFDKIKAGFNEIKNGYVKTFKEGFNDVKSFGQEAVKIGVDALNRTLKGAKVNHIEVPVAFGSGNTSATQGATAGGGVGGSQSGNVGSGGKTGKNNTVSAAEQAKKEEAEIRKAEDLLMQLVEQTAEQRRKAIEVQYNREIEDLRTRLDTEKGLTVTAQEAITTQIIALEQIKSKKLEEFDLKVKAEEIKREQTYIQNMMASVEKGSKDEYNLKIKSIQDAYQLELDQANQETMSEEEKNRLLASINAKYYAEEEAAYKEYHNNLIETQKKAIEQRYQEQILQTQISSNGTDELGVLQLQMQEKQALLLSAQQMEGETIEAFNQRKLQLAWDYQQAKQQVDQKEIDVERGKYEAISGMIGATSQIAEAFGEESKGLAKASKVLALAEIAINTGVALAAGIKQAQSVPFPANIAAIATTVTTILSNVASAIKTVKSAKFAKGGDVTGPGTGTSDSINAMLSNGESVVTASATSMFAPALSAFNQIGGGVPILGNGGANQQIGEEFLARAVARGVAAMPRPVVSVEEINRTSGRVETIERLAAIK